MYSLAECLQGTVPLVREVSSVLLFWSCHTFLLSGALAPGVLLGVMVAFLLVLGLYRSTGLFYLEFEKAFKK